MKRLICLLLVCSLSISAAAHADSAVAWEYNPGDGSIYSSTPVPVSGLDSGVTAIAVGGHHSLAVKDGGLYGWGSNSSGELGDGTTTNRLTPVPISGLASGVTAIAAGGTGGSISHSLAVQNGGLFAWGRNFAGQLGDGTFSGFRSTPAPVIGMDSGVTAVAAGDQHSLAKQNDGLYAWGSNSFGQIGNGTLPTGPLDVNVRFLTPVAVIGLSSGVTAIAAGRAHSLAVKDGGVYAWGDNAGGQLGHGIVGGPSRSTPELVGGLESGATAVAAGDQFSLAVVNGSAYFWGGPYIGGTPVQVDPTNLTNIVAVAGNDFAYALSSDGRLWSWSPHQSILPSPQQVLAPAGYKFTSIDVGDNQVVATLAAVPEPSALALVAAGLFGLVSSIRRRPVNSRWDS